MPPHSDDHPTTEPNRPVEAPAKSRLPAHATTGEQIGPYRIVETLGEGGFGVVYLADQTAPVRRQVALKVLKPGMDSVAILARFEAERQALAHMDHPGIAKVLDAGATPQGRPYFAMELVRGSPITEYCNLHRLDTAARLRLFGDVCLAVHHAHQKGIIHRDLKPSNILIAMQDDAPVPKVIDFGIAKATRGSLGEHTIHTAHGQFIGTPEYMSPEQAESSGLDIDTRADIYSLGVILYELLTGVLPIDSDRLRRVGSVDIQRILRETDPPKPSTRLGALDDAAPIGDWAAPQTPSAQSIALQRGTDRSSLIRQVRGDLDWITMKAMDKDRTRRYESAAALAADIDRHLGHEPVLAGPPSAGYRVSKFVRRHRGGVAASAVIAVSVIAGLAISITLYHQAEAQRAQAQQQQTLAEQQSLKLQAALNFVSGMFESVNPEEARGREVTVKQVLDKATKQAGVDLADQPEVRAEIFEMLASAYHTLGRYEEGTRYLEQAAESRRAANRTDDVRYYQVQAKLGAVLLSADRLDEAQVALNSALEGRTRLLGPDHADTLYTRGHLAMLAQLQNKNDEAERILREVIKDQTRIVGAGNSATLESRSQLADLLQEAGKFDEALAEARDIAAISAKSLGADSTFTLQAQSILGAILYDMGKDQEAEDTLRSTLALKKKVFGESHGQTLTTTSALLDVLTRRQKLDEAVALGRQLVELGKASLGPDHNSTHTYMSNFAAALTQRKDFAEAEKIYREVLESRTRTQGPTVRGTLAVKNSLGNLLCDTGRVEEGYTILEEVRQSLDATLPEGHWILGLSRSHVGQALLDLKRYDEAKAMLTDGYDRLNTALGPEHTNTRICAKSLADLYKALGDTQTEAQWRLKAAPAATPAAPGAP